MPSLSARSRTNMKGLHPDLIKLIEAAIKEVDFLVLEGSVRTREQMMINYGKGRSVKHLALFGIPAKYAKPTEAKVTWLSNPFNSNHRVHGDGFGHAFDACPLPVDWNDTKGFRKMGGVFKRLAGELGVNIEWGGDWKKKDYPHIELH